MAIVTFTRRALVVCWLSGLCAFAQTPFFFLQGSDPQFGMYTDNKSFEQETANFEFFIVSANRLKPAFVVVTGDLVNQPGSSAQIDEFFRIADKLDKSIPLYLIAGNHDVGNKPTPESVTAFTRRFKQDHYTFRQGPVKGIVLDSTLIHTPDSAGEAFAEQERWLKAELKRPLPEGVTQLIVFQHHPWFLERADEPDQYFNIPLVRRREYLRWFQEAGVHYLISGHYHRNAVAESARLNMITTGPIGKPLGPDGSGFRIVKVTPAGVQHEWISLGNVPNRVEEKKTDK